MADDLGEPCIGTSTGCRRVPAQVLCATAGRRSVRCHGAAAEARNCRRARLAVERRPAAVSDDPGRVRLLASASRDVQLQRLGDRREEGRSEEHTSELQSLMRISYAVFCLKKKKNETHTHATYNMKNT